MRFNVRSGSSMKLCVHEYIEMFMCIHAHYVRIFIYVCVSVYVHMYVCMYVGR